MKFKEFILLIRLFWLLILFIGTLWILFQWFVSFGKAPSRCQRQSEEILLFWNVFLLLSVIPNRSFVIEHKKALERKAVNNILDLFEALIKYQFQRSSRLSSQNISRVNCLTFPMSNCEKFRLFLTCSATFQTDISKLVLESNGLQFPTPNKNCWSIGE